MGRLGRHAAIVALDVVTIAGACCAGFAVVRGERVLPITWLCLSVLVLLVALEWLLTGPETWHGSLSGM